MKKKLLSLAMALAMCLGLTVPAFAKDLKDTTEQDILDTFTICRNGSVDEKKGCYGVDTPFKLLGLEDKAIEKEGYYVIGKDDAWTITNTGSKELSASGNTDYELLIQLILYYPEDGANDEYVYRGNYYWSDENYFFPNDSKVVRLNTGESVTIPASSFMTAGGGEVDSSPIYELRVNVSYQGVFDDWQYYKVYYQDMLVILRSGSFYFRVDEDQKALIDSSGIMTPSTPADPKEPAEPPEPPAAPAFTDVPAGIWYEAAVNWAAEQGCINGVGNNRFAPLSDCTHAQILTMLWRAAGEPAAKASSPFKVDSAYQGAVDWAYEQDMIDDSFVSNAACARADAVKFIWQAFGRQSAVGSSFTDVSADADYAAAVAWAVGLGITDGTGNGQFSPDKICSRGTIATFLHRAYVPEARLK